jgi:hypothetical protein
MRFTLNPFTGKIDAVASPNELDDYEEGTWTPTQGAGFTITGDFIASGAYKKIGNLVSYAGLAYGTAVIFLAGYHSHPCPFRPEALQTAINQLI